MVIWSPADSQNGITYGNAPRAAGMKEATPNQRISKVGGRTTERPDLAQKNSCDHPPEVDALFPWKRRCAKGINWMRAHFCVARCLLTFSPVWREQLTLSVNLDSSNIIQLKHHLNISDRTVVEFTHYRGTDKVFSVTDLFGAFFALLPSTPHLSTPLFLAA